MTLVKCPHRRHEPDCRPFLPNLTNHPEKIIPGSNGLNLLGGHEWGQKVVDNRRFMAFSPIF